jgi:hypothetical protein
MFSDFEERFAREQLQAIASGYVGSLGADAQQAALECVTLTLEQWKCERAIAQGRNDGTIEIETMVGLVPIVPSKRIVSLDEVKPEECAGPSVRSAYELFRRLHDEEYQPIMDLADRLGLQRLAALLVQRDALIMPLPTLALATRSLWMTVDFFAHDLLRGVTESRAKSARQQAGARARALEKRAENALYRQATIKRLGIQYFQDNPTAENEDAAAFIWLKVKDTIEFRRMTQGGIERKLGGVKRSALGSLARK